MEQFERDLLKNIAGISGFMPGSAFSLRRNGQGVERKITETKELIIQCVMQNENNPLLDNIILK